MLAGGSRPEERRAATSTSPTVITNLTPDMPVYREELFGPVMPIIPFDDADQALALANATEYGLAAYVQTHDLNTAIRMYEGLEFGMVAVNDWLPSTPEMPFGGMKASGMGREYGQEGLHEYMETKAVFIGGFQHDTPSKFPKAVNLQIDVVNLQPEHIPELVRLQRLSFPTLTDCELLNAKPSIASHLELFPEGQFVALAYIERRNDPDWLDQHLPHRFRLRPHPAHVPRCGRRRLADQSRPQRRMAVWRGHERAPEVIAGCASGDACTKRGRRWRGGSTCAARSPGR